MDIRPEEEISDIVSKSFSDDVLKIELSGPDYEYVIHSDKSVSIQEIEESASWGAAALT